MSAANRELALPRFAALMWKSYWERGILNGESIMHKGNSFVHGTLVENETGATVLMHKRMNFVYGTRDNISSMDYLVCFFQTLHVFHFFCVSVFQWTFLIWGNPMT